jgi:hypothetical protein
LQELFTKPEGIDEIQEALAKNELKPGDYFVGRPMSN